MAMNRRKPASKARVTSSSTRSKGKAPAGSVSSDKGRKARARVSTAKTTSSESRARTGTARVTGSGGRGAGAQRAVGRRQEANRKTQNARAQRINAGAKPAASAGRGGALARRQPNSTALARRQPNSTALARRSDSSPSTKDGRQPRAITNGRSATMRQIRAKAVQARRMGQGKPTVASRNPGITPDSKRGQNIRSMARQQRVIGDSGKVRAAEVQGRKLAAQAQARRGAKAASKRMEDVLKTARTIRNVVGAAKGLSRGGLHVAIAKTALTARNTADGTLTAAQKRGDAIKGTKYTNTYNTAGPRDKVKASDFNKKTFNEAFRTARSSGAKEFTWRGNRYNTKKKGE